MYQVLARKWRPKTFASLKGQNHITQALTNALTRQQLHHAYLFTGTRGVGKTSIARILAKSLNCETGITATPCGECRSCKDIDAGNFVDLIEVDGASRTRVEDTRELLENVQYAPTQGRFKIYLVDEVHMLSTHSFNALLKTLEEPPAHVKFILATTDPDRIPMTILSRCLRLSLKALPVTEVMAQCQTILEQENQAFDPVALRKIASAADGSMRDALSLLEQAIAYCDGRIEVAAVDDMLGMSYQRFMPELLQALSRADVAACLHVVEKMSNVAPDFSQVLSALLQIFHALGIAQALKQESVELASLAEIPPELMAFKQAFAPEDIQLMYQIALNGQRDLPYAPSARTCFEMTLLRMMVFSPVSVPVVAKPMAATPAPAIPAPAVQTPVAPVLKQPAPVAPVQPPIAAPVTPAVFVPAPAPLAASGELDWAHLSNQLELSGFARMLVKHSIVSKWDGQQLHLTLDTSQKMCLSPQRQGQIQDALSQHLGRSIKLHIALGDVNANTPIVQEQLQTQERHEKATQSVIEDQQVKHLLATFNATVEKITVNESNDK